MWRVFGRTARLRTGARLLLPVLLLAGCGEPRQTVEIPFAAHYGDTPLLCNQPVGDIRLTDLRLFVHDLRLLTPNREEVSVALAELPPWQGGAVALLDLEDGSEACRNGTAAVNTSLHGTVPPGQYTGLVFRIGVPASRNHANPLLAPPPLDQPAMHWHWLTGYKFLRAGIATETDGFWIHLGSTRCDGTVSAPEGCANHNRPQVLLPDFTPGDSIVIDLAVLAASVDLGDGKSTDCSSGPTETACTGPFGALGLDFTSGKTAGTPPVVRVTKQE